MSTTRKDPRCMLWYGPGRSVKAQDSRIRKMDGVFVVRHGNRGLGNVGVIETIGKIYTILVL